MKTQPAPPLITCSFKAGCQSLTKGIEVFFSHQYGLAHLQLWVKFWQYIKRQLTIYDTELSIKFELQVLMILTLIENLTDNIW
jgi:hypothetical protein